MASTCQLSPVQKIARSVLPAMMALVLSACVGFIPPTNLKPPEVGFSDLEISDIGLSNIKFVVSIAADNKNDVDLPLNDMKFDLALMGNDFATGVAKESNLVVPKNSSKVVPIEFSVPTSRLINIIKTGIKKDANDLGKFNYVLKGSARWGTGPFTVPFERKGDLSALKSLSDLLKTIVN